MSDLVVSISGLEVVGHHGVHPEERVLGQRFVVDVEMFLAHDGAAKVRGCAWGRFHGRRWKKWGWRGGEGN